MERPRARPGPPPKVPRLSASTDERRNEQRGRVTKRVVGRIWGAARASIERSSDADGPRLAASMSYYAVFSLFPLLMVLGALAEYALGDSQTLRDRLLRWAAGSASTTTR